MGLKALIKEDEYNGLNDDLKALYKQSEDGSEEFILDLDDKDFKERIGEFRSTNIRLKQEREKMEKQLEKFKDVDLDAYKEMKKKLEDMEDEELIDKNKIDELVDKRTERMRSELSGQNEALLKRAETAELERDNYRSRLSEVLIDSEVTKAVSEVGTVKKGGMTDVLARAHQTWKLIDGKPTPMRGDEVVFGKDGKSPMSMKEWSEGLLEDASFLFEGNKGGGGQGNDDHSNRGTGQSKVVDAHDRTSFGSNIEEIAKGNVRATMK